MLGYVLFNIFAWVAHQSSKPCLLGACKLLCLWYECTCTKPRCLRAGFRAFFPSCGWITGRFFKSPQCFIENKGVLLLGFSEAHFLHCVCRITGRFFQQHCSGSSVFWKTRAFIHHFVVLGLWWVSLVLEEAHWRAIAYHSWRYVVVCLIFDEKCLYLFLWDSRESCLPISSSRINSMVKIVIPRITD